MPEISRFFGISILMYHNDHAPPHFHVRYAGERAIIEIGPALNVRGQLSPRVLGMVVEWASLHRAELFENWERARNQLDLLPVEPLR